MKKNNLFILSLLIIMLGTNQNTKAQSLFWANGMGGPGSDYVNEMALDASGNIYICGSIGSVSNFNPGLGTSNLAFAGGEDIFLAKYDNSGNYLWGFSLGGVGYERAHSIATDGSGNVYITGNLQGVIDFDPGNGTANLSSSGSNDGFLAKYSPSGNYLWAISVGGTLSDACESIEIDAFGGIYLAGYFQGLADFDPGAGITNLTSNGNRDLFLAKYDIAGNFLWARGIGGSGTEEAAKIKQDIFGDLYLVGAFEDTVDFDPGFATANLIAINSQDIFVAKFDANGNYVWAKAIGGDNTQIGANISFDAIGNSYITGFFTTTTDFDPNTGVAELTSAGSFDAFLLKMNPQGNYLWAKGIGGTGLDVGSGLTVSPQGFIYLNGNFRDTVVFGPNPANILISEGSSDAFLAKYDTSGNLIWVNGLGNLSDDISKSVIVDSLGFIYITGYFEDIVDLDFGIATANPRWVGGPDTYLAKYKEFQLDASAHLLSPAIPVTTGQSDSVRVIIYNNGLSDSLFTAQLGYRVNNQLPLINSWSGMIPPGQTDTFTFNTPFLIPGQDFIFKTWISSINAGTGPDANPSNDTMTVKLCMALAGDYTVGDSLSTFLTIEEAFGTLSCGGIGAPVRLLLAPGHYGHGYEFGDIPGMSVHGLTITSRTGIASDVIFGGTPSGNSISLKGANNMILDKISILNPQSPADSRAGIQIEESSKIIISACRFEGDQASTSNDNSLLNIIGNNTYIKVIDCSFFGGYYGIFSSGQGVRKYLEISNNTFSNIHHTSVHISGATTSSLTEEVMVNGNTIDNTTFPTVHISGIGINLTSTTRFSIKDNMLFGYLGRVALFASNFSGDSLQPNKIYNNVANLTYTGTIPKVVHLTGNALSGTDYIEVYHNSFEVGLNSTSTTQNGAFYIQGGSAAEPAISKAIFKNNVLKVKSTHTNGTTPVNFRSWYITLDYLTTKLVSNHNAYHFPTAAAFGRINDLALNINTLTNWQSSKGLDSSSIQADPFYNDTTLVPSLSSPLRGAGTAVNIINDINGYLRSLTTPTIGAHELCNAVVAPAVRSICHGSSFSFAGQTLTTSGNYSHTFAAGNGGCDSTVNLTLTVLTPDSVQQSATICRGSSYDFAGQQLTTAGTYYATLVNTSGCDSVVALQLTVQGDSVQAAVAICTGDSYPFGTQQLTTAGTYTHTFSTTAGCDSVVTLTLTINTILTSNLSAAICPGSSYSFDGQQLTSAGTYRDTLVSLNGCDSMVTLTLSVNPTHNTTITAGICPGGSYSFGGQTLTTAGIFNHTFQNSFGCDSTVALTLSINPTHNITTTASICPGGNYLFGSQLLTTAGTYNHTFHNSFSCDSAVALTLSIDSSLSPARTINASFCAGSSYSFNGQTYTTAGTFVQLIAAANCDSLITLNLTVNTVDTAVTINDFTLTANAAANATYEWLDCNDGLPIPGATGRIYTVTANGSYALITTQNGCKDTSACYAFTGVGVSEIAGLKDIRLYPNPSNGVVYLSYEQTGSSPFDIRVLDSRGREVYKLHQDAVIGATVISLPLETLSEGVYSVLLESAADGRAIRKLVKTK